MIKAERMERQLNEQGGPILTTAAEVIREVVRGDEPPPDTDPPLSADLAAMPVNGAFVSLHAAERLRGCCGNLGEEKPLGRSLMRAAKATCRDHRFRHLTMNELDGLELEVSVLYDWRWEAAPPAERPAAVAPPDRGCRLRDGPNEALLLPSVARRKNLDPEEFLDAVCRKAGLPISAWRHPEAHLETFRAIELRTYMGEV